MAMKIRRVSPSALAATEVCPRFRPDGKDNAAAIDGTMLHEFAEEMVSIPRDQWDGWIATRNASPDMKGMLEVIAATYRTIITEDMEVFRDYRLRMRGGRPRKSPLKPGLYPECEVDRGQGSHGYLDLMIVTPEGLTYILDIKSSRVEHDFSRQLEAYACDVNRLCPAHENFVCRIVAPRLDDDAQPEWHWGPEDIARFNREIEAIEFKADWSSNDSSIAGVPNDACQYCRYNGRCQYQASATRAVAEIVDEDLVLVSAKTGRTTIMQALPNLVGRNGPYAGEAVTAQTFLNPPTPAQRGLRRACLKFLETFIEAAKKDDASWAAQFTDDQLKNLVPGFSVSRRRGRGSVDTGRMPEIREAVMGQLGLGIEDVFDVSVIDKKQLAESLVDSGAAKSRKEADEKVEKIYAPFTSVGAPTLFWTQKAVTPALEA